MSKISIKGNNIVDLTHILEPEIPCFPGFPSPKIEFFNTHEKGDTFNVEIVTFCPHTGTHLDSPWHLIKGAKKLDDLAGDCILGNAVVVDVSKKEGNVPITAEDIKEWEAKTNVTIQEGDAVLLYSGHDKTWNLGKEGEKFWNKGWPYLNKDGAEYLASKKIRLLGMEPMSIDQYGTTDYPAHHVILGNDIIIIENLKNLAQLPSRCQIIATPLRIKGGSGSPVRVLAVF